MLHIYAEYRAHHLLASKWKWGGGICVRRGATVAYVQNTFICNIRRLDTLGQLGHHPGVDFARDDLLRRIQQPYRHVASTRTNLKNRVRAAYRRL
jgi:hypothetical protein